MNQFLQQYQMDHDECDSSELESFLQSCLDNVNILDGVDSFTTNVNIASSTSFLPNDIIDSCIASTHSRNQSACFSESNLHTNVSVGREAINSHSNSAKISVSQTSAATSVLSVSSSARTWNTSTTSLTHLASLSSATLKTTCSTVSSVAVSSSMLTTTVLSHRVNSRTSLCTLASNVAKVAPSVVITSTQISSASTVCKQSNSHNASQSVGASLVKSYTSSSVSGNIAVSSLTMPTQQAVVLNMPSHLAAVQFIAPAQRTSTVLRSGTKQPPHLLPKTLAPASLRAPFVLSSPAPTAPLLLAPTVLLGNTGGQLQYIVREQAPPTFAFIRPSSMGHASGPQISTSHQAVLLGGGQALLLPTPGAAPLAQASAIRFAVQNQSFIHANSSINIVNNSICNSNSIGMGLRSQLSAHGTYRKRRKLDNISGGVNAGTVSHSTITSSSTSCDAATRIHGAETTGEKRTFLDLEDVMKKSGIFSDEDVRDVIVVDENEQSEVSVCDRVPISPMMSSTCRTSPQQKTRNFPDSVHLKDDQNICHKEENPLQKNYTPSSMSFPSVHNHKLPSTALPHCRTASVTIPHYPTPIKSFSEHVADRTVTSSVFTTSNNAMNNDHIDVSNTGSIQSHQHLFVSKKSSPNSQIRPSIQLNSCLSPHERLKNYIERNYRLVENPRGRHTHAPFTSRLDAICRLMPYHVYSDNLPSTLSTAAAIACSEQRLAHDEQLASVEERQQDDIFELQAQYTQYKFNIMLRKYQRLMLKDSMKLHATSESVQLLRYLNQRDRELFEYEQSISSCTSNLAEVYESSEVSTSSSCYPHAVNGASTHTPNGITTLYNQINSSSTL